MSTNPNLATVRRKAVEMGAVITGVREGARHTIVTLRTREGRSIQLSLSRYRIDRYIMEGWTRQAIKRVARYEFDVANDNEIPRQRG